MRFPVVKVGFFPSSRKILMPFTVVAKPRSHYASKQLLLVHRPLEFPLLQLSNPPGVNYELGLTNYPPP